MTPSPRSRKPRPPSALTATSMFFITAWLRFMYSACTQTTGTSLYWASERTYCRSSSMRCSSKSSPMTMSWNPSCRNARSACDIERTNVSSWPGRQSRTLASISGTLATRTLADTGMRSAKQSPFPDLNEGLESVRGEPVAPVAVGGRLLRMRGEDGGGAFFLRLLSKQLQNLARIFGIQVPRRLVRQDELRLANERARD